MRMILRMIAAATLIPSGSCNSAQERTLIPSLERLAKDGNAEAIYHLGMAYQTGVGVTEDHAKALDAFRRAAALGDPLAAYKLGCYYDGQGEGLVDADAETALRYKLIAAKAGYALAQQDAGVLYARRGDVPEALIWLEKSAAQGWSGGLMTLASVYNGAPGVKPDPAKTAAYFQLLLTQTAPSEQQITWLKHYRESLSPDDKKRAAEIVQSYRATPTPLTIKGLSGQRAAQVLIGSPPQS